MLSVPYTSAASMLITTSQHVRVLWIRGEDNTHIFETVFEFHENISDQDIVFVHLPKIQSKSWPIGSLSLLSKRRNNQDLISLSCQAHHMLLCSSVRILSRNLPSQFGTWQHQINILKVTQSTGRGNQKKEKKFTFVCGITIYSPGGRVKKVTTSRATLWFVTSRGFCKGKNIIFPVKGFL